MYSSKEIEIWKMRGHVHARWSYETVTIQIKSEQLQVESSLRARFSSWLLCPWILVKKSTLVIRGSCASIKFFEETCSIADDELGKSKCHARKHTT